MKKLTIVMPYLNEGYEPLYTLQSILFTGNSDLVDVIIIDDHSLKQPDDLKDKLETYKNVTLVRNDERLGLPKCRDLGSNMAKTPHILVIDSHMRFKKDDWLNKINNLIESEPETMWCTTCSVLNKNHLDVYRPRKRYYGAYIALINKKNNEDSRPARSIIEPKWITRKRTGPEIPCLLGANYFFAKEWWKKIRGWNGLEMWGTAEPFISMKTWMAGGKCRICTDIEIGHIFRDNAPYVTQVWPLIYNKLFICKTIIPEDVEKALLKHIKHTRSFDKAMNLMDINKNVIDEQRDYYDSIFVMSFDEYCRKFDMGIPTC